MVMITMVKKIKVLVICSIVLAFSLVANATYAQAGWSWITESALSKFTPEDIKLLKDAGRDALDNQPDQSEVQWSNADTGHSGSITVTDTRQINDKTCRNALFKNNAKNIKGTVRYVLCQQTDSTWIVSSPND